MFQGYAWLFIHKTALLIWWICSALFLWQWPLWIPERNNSRVTRGKGQKFEAFNPLITRGLGVAPMLDSLLWHAIRISLLASN